VSPFGNVGTCGGSSLPHGTENSCYDQSANYRHQDKSYSVHVHPTPALSDARPCNLSRHFIRRAFAPARSQSEASLNARRTAFMRV